VREEATTSRASGVMPATAGPSPRLTRAATKTPTQSVTISVVIVTSGAALCWPADGGQYFRSRAWGGAAPSQTLTPLRSADQTERWGAKKAGPSPPPAAIGPPAPAGGIPPPRAGTGGRRNIEPASASKQITTTDITATFHRP